MIRVHRYRDQTYSKEVYCSGCGVSLINEPVTEITIKTENKWELCDDCAGELTRKLKEVRSG